MKATVSCVAMASSQGGPTAVDGLKPSKTLIGKAMRHGQRNVKTPQAGSQAHTPAGCALAGPPVFSPSAHPQMPSRGRCPLTNAHDVDHASATKRRDAAPPPDWTHYTRGEIERSGHASASWGQFHTGNGTRRGVRRSPDALS